VEQSGGAKADAGRRYRAYPTPERAGCLTGWGHSCRAVWNLALAQRDHLYRHRGVTLRANTQCVQLTGARRDLPWLADLPAQSVQQVLRQLDRAYDNWWNPQHPADAPMFRKRSTGLSVPFPGQAVKVRLRCPGPRESAGMRPGVRLHRLRPPSARRPQRRGKH
jgi:putative transposase